MSYGCELWGVQELSELERVHTNALKTFLNVSLHASNTIVYGETGRYPLFVNFKVRCIKYWFRLLQLPNARIARQSYTMLYRLSENGSENWVSKIRDLLCSNGFGIVWLFKEVGNEKSFCKILKERLRDCFMQGWNSQVTMSENYTFYAGFKDLLQSEQFLISNYLCRSYKKALSRFRMGVSEINTHRYKFYADKKLQNCPFCAQTKEDEFHVLFICKQYEDLRILCLPEGFLENRTMFNMFSLLRENSYSLAKFLYLMFCRRRDVLS